MPRRSAISLEQKKALREYRRLHPTVSNTAIKRWFEDSFQQRIAHSSVSEILSNRYGYLDHPIHRQPDQKRYRREQWPELENALALWIQRAQQHIAISSITVLENAEFFWGNLSVYKGRPMPSFSNGWLRGFQQRRAISYRPQHSMRDNENLAPCEMKPIRQTLSTFHPKDIFNCDETWLFWKRIPDRSFSRRSIPGCRKDEARFTVHFCCNMDGSERLPLWLIGCTASPRAFRVARINIHNLGIHWRASKRAWMTAVLMEEWLRWFDRQMSGRKVALLLDNFSAHESAVERINRSKQPLQNTLIVWLPPNLASPHQPLNQGITLAWKSFWWRERIRYMLREFEAGRDPLSSINILNAIRWAIKAWEFDLSEETIINCFQRGLSTPAHEDGQIQALPIADMCGDLQRLKDASAIRDPTDIEQFINPVAEQITDNLEHLRDQILAQFDVPMEEEEDDDEEEEDGEILSLVTTLKALEALQTLRMHQEQQEESDIGLIKRLNCLEIELESKSMGIRHQF